MDELKAWGAHCERCFAQKENPPTAEYFVGHFDSDPMAVIDGIRVASLPNGEILATCRVFHRKIYVGGQSMLMGGIGEVCTRPEARGLGLAKRLLNDAIKYMVSQGMVLSALHAADWVAPLYRKLGWSSVALCWTFGLLL